MRTARLLNLRRIRRQPLRVAICVVAIAAGVSFAVAVLILNRSTNKTIDEFTAKLAGPTELRVIGATSRGGLDQGVLPKVEQTPGVAAAIPVVQAVTYIDAGPGRDTITAIAFGIDCRIEQLFGSFGCNQAALDAAGDKPPVVGPALAKRLGPTAQVLTDRGRRPLDRNLTLPQLDQLNQGNVLVYPLRAAQVIFARPGRLDAIYVKPAPGVAVADLQHRLQEAVGAWNGVLRSTDPPPGAGVVAAAFLPAFGMLSVVALAIGALLIYNTLTLSLEDRRRDLAVIGALGGRARTVIGGVLLEAALFGTVGGVLGTLGGALLAGPMTSGVSDFTRKFMGVPVRVSASPSTVLFGAVLGALVGVAAAWIPARRATRMDVAAELSLRDRRAETAARAGVRRTIVYGVLAVVGSALCWASQVGGSLRPWQPSLAPVGMAVASLGLLLTVGSSAALVARLTRRLGRSDGATRLGLANIVRDPGRTGVMSIAIGSAVAIGFLIASTRVSIHDAIAGSVSADESQRLSASLIPMNNTLNVDAKMSADLIDKIAAVPGVAAVSRQVAASVGHSDAQLTGVAAQDITQLDAFPLIKGSNDQAGFEAGNVLVGTALARSEGLEPGDTYRLPTPTGFADVRVGGIWQNGNFTGRVVDMPRSLFVKLYGDEPPNFVDIVPAPGVDPDELAGRIRALNLDPDLDIATPAESVERDSAEISELMGPFEAVQRGMLIIAFVAVLSTLLLVGAQRRRELGLLAAVGMEPRQLARMTVVEGVGVSVIAVVLATIAGGIMNVAFTWIVPVIIGFKDPIRFDFGAAALSAVIAVAVVALASGFPAWRTSRVEVLEALQYE